jgi:hypothetical protein
MEGAHGMYVSLYCRFEMKALHIDDRFRWVALQLDDLQSCLNARAVEQQLKSLPKNLDETYDRLLSKITKDYCGDAHKFLQWLAFSARPLMIHELAEVVSVDFDQGDEPHFDPECQYLDPYDVVSVCSALITISEGKNNIEVAGESSDQ